MLSAPLLCGDVAHRRKCLQPQRFETGEIIASEKNRMLESRSRTVFSKEENRCRIVPLTFNRL